jgi:tetratricopeptide (TPR) repeat protein
LPFGGVGGVRTVLGEWSAVRAAVHADHPSTLLSRNNLADAYQEVGRLDEAIALYTRTLADYERVLGPDHPDHLRSRNNLAYVYRVAGRLDEAIPLFTRTLADYERVLGPDHPDTLTSRNNLAHAYHAVGRLDEAIPLFTRTLADRERVLGPDHPDTLRSRNSLAYAYQEVGRLDEAEALRKDGRLQHRPRLRPCAPGIASGGQGSAPGPGQLRDARVGSASHRAPEATRPRPPGPGRTSGGALHLDQADAARPSEACATGCRHRQEVPILDQSGGRVGGRSWKFGVRVTSVDR